jgi:hypothetical protein
VNFSNTRLLLLMLFLVPPVGAQALEEPSATPETVLRPEAIEELTYNSPVDPA